MKRPKTSKLPKYVYRSTAKGRVYYKFRGPGAIKHVRLPGTPDTPEFHTAYARLISAPPMDAGRYTPGSVAHTIQLYYNSADFSQLAEGTQRDYRRYLTRLDKVAGGRLLASIESSFIHKLRDALRDRPVAANHAIAVMRTLFKFALSRKLMVADPTAGIGKLKGGDGYARWTKDDIAAFRAVASPMMALALDLGLYTGQRLSDVIRMSWTNYDGQRIRLRQQKTGTSLVIPVHPDLRATLDALPRTGLMILTSKTGLAFHSRVFSRDFMRTRVAAKLPAGLSFHGLRHTAASVLAELGAGAPEIQAITGHKSLRLVEHYIRQANQETQADRAIARLPNR